MLLCYLVFDHFQSINRSINHFIRSVKAAKQTTCTGGNGTEQDRQGSEIWHWQLPKC